MKRAIILTENEQPIFRLDFNVKNGQDNIEKDIAQFIVSMDKKKNMVSSKRVIKMIHELNHLSLETVLDFFSKPENIKLFIRELDECKKSINDDIKRTFTRANIKDCLIEALKE